MSSKRSALRILVPAASVMVAAFIGLGAGNASADPSPAPVPGSPDAPGPHGSLEQDRPGDSGDSGWGYLPNADGVECENAWIVCNGTDNPPESAYSNSHDDAGGWVSAPDDTGAECENPGVVCTNVG